MIYLHVVQFFTESLTIQQLNERSEDLLNVDWVIIVAIVDQMTKQVKDLGQHLVVGNVLLITMEGLKKYIFLLPNSFQL